MYLLLSFILKWIVNSAGIWLTLRLFNASNQPDDFAATASIFLVAGLILTAVNILLKPIITLLSLPITIITLGLFMLVVNGLMVYIALRLAPDISITFGQAVMAGVIIGIANFVMSGLVKTVKA